MTGASKLQEQRQTSATETYRSRVASRTRDNAKVEDETFANISSNTFYSIMFSEQMTPEEKQKAITSAFVFEGSKEENRERIKEFEVFKEYLQNVRETMARQIIQLTDTETYAELQRSYQDFNNSLIDFDEKLKPLTDIIDAVHNLRINGETLNAFIEIKDLKKRQEERAARIAELDQKANELLSNLKDTDLFIAKLGEEKSFFGFGGVKESARVQIAQLQVERSGIVNEIDAINQELGNLRTSEVDIGNVAFAEEKKQLSELLNVTSEEHTKRQKDLVESAIHFQDTAKARIGSVRQHLSGMSDQILGLYDANGKMTQVYAILADGIKEAETKNQEIRQTVITEKEGESMVEKMLREDKKTDIEGHIAMLDASAVDTLSTYSDLTTQKIRIKSMKDANDSQIQKARNMHTQGVAGVADRLSVVIQAVSSAALGESSAIAGDTLARMSENTNKVAQKESIRNAMGISDQNAELQKVIDDLASYGEITKNATEITREGVKEMRQKLDEMRAIAEEVQKDVKDAIAVNAEEALGVKNSSEKKNTKATSTPFGI